MIKKDGRRLRAMSLKIKRHKDDVQFLHKVRVRAKKFGYVLDLLEPVLGSETSRLTPLIKKNQKVFGTLHDMDCAIEKLSESSPHVKTSERQSLQDEIRKLRKRALKHALGVGRKLGKEL